MTSALEAEIKDLIISALNLDEVTPGDIDSDADLFGTGGLSLDSIDALEIGVALQKKYGIKINQEEKDLNAQFKSVRTLANFVARVR